MPVSDQAFVTLATNDMYCQGALVLGQSLRNQRATRKLVVLVTLQVSSLLRVILSRVFDEVIEVNLIDSADYIHLAFLKRPELGVTLTKLHCWTLTHYSKCVFLDADTLVLSNIDDLFERGEFSAAPDPGWPDCFNSGVFVFQPSLETHSLLLQHATDHGSFDGADQGLLNSFFSSWATADIHKHLPFTYNLSSNAAYTYSPAFKQFGSSAKVVHFLGSTKPWDYTYNPQTGSVSKEGSGLVPEQQASFLNLWWAIYHQSILPLYGSVHGEDESTFPGHTACLRGVGVPCANSAHSAEGQCAHSVPGAREPCANSATGSSQSWNAEDPLEPTVVMDGTPPSPGRGRLEDMVGWPDIETSAGVMYNPLSSTSPQFADFTETPTASQPVDKREGGPSEESVELSQEPPVDITRDPRPQDALQVDLAISVSEISIEEKVMELSPEEERRQWEEGRIDYMGKDAFARIQEKLDRFLQ
ncbi:glycogenin-2 isoform X1 [Rhinolophus sinicus]|uniref:glycogenin-2 isoform X1 n=1 Tax=Rhinolophus sinicus TaxID=89399 RepID=UPI003D79B1A8